MENNSTFVNIPEQQQYSKIIYYLNLIGLFILVGGFTLYLTGIFSPLVPLEELPRYWSLSLDQFIEKTNMPTGWQWTSKMVYGDVTPLLGIAVLASVTFVCYFVLLFQFLKRGIKTLALIVSIELLLILLSASNLIQITH